MLKKTITYTDYNGQERTESFYFNLTKTELIEMDAAFEGGLGSLVEKIRERKDAKTLMEIFKDLIIRSYGEKSLDGKYFIKNQEVKDKFMSTEAYSELFMEMLTTNKAVEFVNGIVPKGIITNKDLKDAGITQLIQNPNQE